MTDMLERTNTKPTTGTESAFPEKRATLAANPPSAREPVSPIKTLARETLKRRYAPSAPVRQKQNTGIAFSIFGDNPAGMAVVTALTAVMIIVIGVVFFKVFKRNTPVRIALAVIEAGAIGNFIDRLCLVNESGMRYVRDFLDMSNFRPFAWLGSNFNFGVCNLADFYITFGAVALVLILLFIGKDAVIPLKKSWREQARKEKLRETEDAEERGD